MRCGGVFNLFEFTNPGVCDVINELIISVKSKYDVYNSVISVSGSDPALLFLIRAERLTRGVLHPRENLNLI